jgi:hypothetical protein
MVGDFLVGPWNFITVEIYALPAHDMITLDAPALPPLVPLRRGADAELDGKAVAEHIAQGVFMSTEPLAETPLYRAWIERATREEMQKGRSRGESWGCGAPLLSSWQIALDHYLKMP